MGYTITAPIRNVQLRDRLFSFMLANYEEPKGLFGQEGNYSWFGKTGRPGNEKALSYDHGACRLGFDYSSGAPERAYLFSVTRWMSIIAGKRKVFEGCAVALPYYVYDGCEEHAVLVRGMARKPKNWDWSTTDELGWEVPYECDPKTFRGAAWTEFEGNAQFAKEQIAKGRECARIVKAALRRLDKAWRGQL